MAQTLYRVAVDCERCTKGPHRITVLVAADEAHEALDKATQHTNASELWDEDIQRAIASGEISKSRIDRKYSGLLDVVEYVGDLSKTE